MTPSFTPDVVCREESIAVTGRETLRWGGLGGFSVGDSLFSDRLLEGVRGCWVLKQRLVQGLFQGLMREMRQILRLAMPVAAARSGLLIMIAVDTVMVGRVDSGELAAYGIGQSIQLPMLLFGIGLVTGGQMISATLYGAGARKETGAVLRVSWWHALGVGILVGILCQFGEGFLLVTGQQPALAAAGGRVLMAIGWGVPGMLLYAATGMWLESIQRPLPGMLAMLIGNLVNIGLNDWLIYGGLGLGPHGAAGAAWATTGVRWLLLLILLLYIRLRVDQQEYGLYRVTIQRSRQRGRELRRLGLPMGLSQVTESSAFAMMTLMAGRLGIVTMAGYSILFNLLGLMYMFSLGFSTAAGVRVAAARGRGDHFAQLRAGLVPAFMVLILSATLGVIMVTFGPEILTLYTLDPLVMALSLPILLILGFALVPDGVQSVLLGSLRGMLDVWPAVAIQILGFWGVMVIGGWWYAIHLQGGLGKLLIFMGLGAVVVATGLFSRFFCLLKKPN